MMKYTSIVFTAVISVLGTGCSDPKAANEKNFKIAIQENLDKEYPKCYIKQASFPAIKNNSYESKYYTALVAAGLLSLKEEPNEVNESIFSNKKKTVFLPTFNLTEEGKKFYKNDKEINSFTGKITGGFCFGKATVKEVTEFTEPADAGGAKVSQVTFTYQVSDFPAWTKLPEVSAAIAELQKEVESEKTPIKGRDMLVLTNNGWKSR